MTIVKTFLVKIIRKILALVIRPFLNQVVWALTTVAPPGETYRAFSRQGFHLLRKHYYLPIPEEADMEYAAHETELVGVDMNENGAFDLLENVITPYKAEFNAFPVHQPGPESAFYLVNGSFMAIDGNLYYSLIRHFKPRRIIEIGSGNSTLLAAMAIRKNQEESDDKTELICIEPYPMPMLRQNIPEMTQLIEKKVQDVDLSVFTSLEAGDILFIDSTHVLRPGGDVWWEYCEILPRLASGVLVHVHDISLPKPYPRVYFDNDWYWNEQYLLQAFLAFNGRFEVLWPGNYLMTKHPERMQTAFTPEYQHMREKYPSSEPSSFWMRVR